MQKFLKDLQTSLTVYKTLFEDNPDACFAMDASGRFVLLNDAAVHLLGYTREEALGMSYLSMVSEDSRKKATELIATGFKGTKVCDEFALLHKNGRNIDVFITGIPIVTEEGVTGIIGISKDISDQKQTKRELLDSTNQLENILNSIDLCIWSWDVKRKRPITISSASEHIFGYTAEEMITSKEMSYPPFHPADESILNEKIDNLRRGKITKYEYRIIHRSKEVKWVSDYSVPVFDASGSLIRIDGVITDIDQRKKAEERLTHMAFHDPLTELPNRRTLHNSLELAIQKQGQDGGRVAIFYLDLDRFKYINDSLGHDKGDQLLKIVAKRLRGCLRNNDLITRQSGDEFVVLIESIGGMEDIFSIAKKILHVVEQPCSIQGQEFTLTTSIGISVFPDHADNSGELLTKADQAMYLAKEKGKNNFQLYESGLSSELSRTMLLEQGLHQALKNQELSLYYQPIINVKSGTIVGFEALARWNHCKLGWISPGEFIPVAEASGLIGNMGEWILKTAIHQCKQWHDHGYPVYVTVNVSAKQLESNCFISRLKQILSEVGLHSSFVKLEITESTAMAKVESTVKKLKHIEKLGIEVLLDDFGTGYSSLSYLKKFPIATLKIDQSFVAGISKDKSQEAIIKAIIALANSLNISVVAEGVERGEHLTFLAKHGCSLMQGYLFNRPMPVIETEQILKENQMDLPILQEYSEL